MGKSSIEWTEQTWNPVRGCTKVSPGCKHCYAETFAERWRGVKGHPYEQGFDLRLVPDKLEEPLRWKKPSMVFVNSMSDLFQDGVPDAYIDQVLAVCFLAHRHTFQILTKRAKRLHDYFATKYRWALIEGAAQKIHHGRTGEDPSMWLAVHSLPNVWLGVSVEDGQRAEERIGWLLETPAAVRFLSCEPLLGHINLRDIEVIPEKPPHGPRVSIDALTGLVKGPDDVLPRKVDWVIVGGESGAGARPMQLAWARVIVEQCKNAGTPVFCKQLGARPTCDSGELLKLNAKKGGDPAEWPAFFRVREFPR